ncbi:hypothetical protein [Eggerthia catenaformis]|uniref:hypothetical protein n=1 Tax=Eggerthia catenaformis TaxID=31973 RepID=UPI0028F0ED01|nr:hypothetical protein [Eggerthia catenaformis]
MSKMYIFPCNPEHFDIEKYFLNNAQIVWRKPSDIEVGDIAYIYIGKTIREVKYRCKVVSTEVSGDVLEANAYAIPKGKLAAKCSYVILELERTYENGTVTLPMLKENGMGQFMVPMRAKDSLEKLFIDIDNQTGGV